MIEHNESNSECIVFFVSLQLAHPILESLKTTDKEWVVNLMYAFNSGNIAKFEDLKKAWVTQVRL